MTNVEPQKAVEQVELQEKDTSRSAILERGGEPRKEGDFTTMQGKVLRPFAVLEAGAERQKVVERAHEKATSPSVLETGDEVLKKADALALDISLFASDLMQVSSKETEGDRQEPSSLPTATKQDGVLTDAICDPQLDLSFLDTCEWTPKGDEELDDVKRKKVNNYIIGTFKETNREQHTRANLGFPIFDACDWTPSKTDTLQQKWTASNTDTLQQKEIETTTFAKETEGDCRISIAHENGNKEDELEMQVGPFLVDSPCTQPEELPDIDYVSQISLSKVFRSNKEVAKQLELTDSAHLSRTVPKKSIKAPQQVRQKRCPPAASRSAHYPAQRRNGRVLSAKPGYQYFHFYPVPNSLLNSTDRMHQMAAVTQRYMQMYAGLRHIVHHHQRRR